MSAPLRIGQLAAAVGVKTDSVRFYERAGLLPKPSRSANGYRTYDDVTLKRLRFIKKAQSLGFTLDEIRQIFQLSAEGSPACPHVISMAEATLAETEKKLAEMRAFAKSLREHLRKWKDPKQTRRVAADFCKLIEST